MSDITIISHKRSNNFTIVPNHIINADYLKLEDKAFLIWVLSKPDDWKLNTLSLAKIHHVSKDKITAISKRLQKEKHLFIKKCRNGFTQWFIFENPEDCVDFKNTSTDPAIKPYPENQSKPHPEKPDQENQDALLRTDLLPRTEKRSSPSEDVQNSSTSFIDDKFDELWATWPNTKQKIRAKKSFRAVLSKFKMKSPDSINKMVIIIKNDINERLRLTMNRFDDGFRNSMFTTYLNNVGWGEPLPDKPVDIKDTDEARAASIAKGRELFG